MKCNSIAIMRSFVALASLLAVVCAHEDHDQAVFEGPHEGLWYNTLPGDGGKQVSQLVSSVRLALTPH